MNKLILFLAFTFISMVSYGQNLYSKDGKLLGDQNKLITNCSNGVNAKSIEINNLTIDSKNYCKCVITNIFPLIYYSEIESQGDSLIYYIISNEKYLETILSCIDRNAIYGEHKMDNSTKTDLYRYSAISQCEKEIKKDIELSKLLSDNQIKEGCTCAIKEILDYGFTVNQIDSLNIHNSTILEDAYQGCFIDYFK